MNKINHEHYGPKEIKQLLSIIAPQDLKKKGNLDSNLILNKFHNKMESSMIKIASV